ncbi:MAG: hypothetical protein ABI211_06700 [Vicinamibacterales bacterium]
MNPLAPVPGPDYKVAIAAKGIVAILATAILLWHYWSTRKGQAPSRQLNAALVLVGLLGGAGWWNYGAFHFVGGFIHYHEFFHYYLGSKYFEELGYTGLYECVAVAEAEAGRGATVSRRWIRNLSTNELALGTPALQEPSRCRDRFADPARWPAFTHDVEWFRQHVTAGKWNELTADHGYNATPVWTMAGARLANLAPVSVPQIWALALLDPVLLAAMWGLVWWAFGWRVLAIALVWWGTNYPARYTYIGGGYLREDWLLWSVAAVCLAKRGWMAASGSAIAWATLLRVFPGFPLVAVAFSAAQSVWRTKRLPSSVVRFGVGGLIAAVLLAGASLLGPHPPEGGVASWRGFVANSRKHLATPLTNNVGVPELVTFDPATRSARVRELWLDSPWDVWKDARLRLFEERFWLYVALVAAYLALLLKATAGQPLWTTLILGMGVIPFLTNLTCYYYGFLLIFAALWPRYPLAGIGLTAASALTCITPALLSQDDDRYMAISLIITVYVVGLTAWLAFRPDAGLEAGHHPAWTPASPGQTSHLPAPDTLPVA